MDSAWVAGIFGLIGSFIGAGASLGGVRLAERARKRDRHADLRRHQIALLSAYAAELELTAQLARARAKVFGWQLDRGVPVQSSILRTEVIGRLPFLSRMAENFSVLPSEVIGDLTAALAICEASDSAALRWVEHTEVVSADKFRAMKDLIEGAADRCASTAEKLRQWIAAQTD